MSNELVKASPISVLPVANGKAMLRVLAQFTIELLNIHAPLTASSQGKLPGLRVVFLTANSRHAERDTRGRLE